MGKTYRGDHEFPAEFGFTGSSGKVMVKGHARRPAVRRPAPAKDSQMLQPPPSGLKMP